MVISLVPVLFAYGHGTTAGTALTNQASVTASNLATPVTQWSTNVVVRTQAGGYWSSADNEDQSAGVGSKAGLATYLTNLCNYNSVFTVRVYLATNGVSSTEWTNRIYIAGEAAVDFAIAPATALGLINNDDTQGLAPAASVVVGLTTILPGNAVNADRVAYNFLAEPVTAAASAYIEPYTGDNGTVYGGNIGVYSNTALAVGGMKNVPLIAATSPDNIFTVICQGPVLTIFHTIDCVTNTTTDVGEAGAGSIYGLPGSTVTYRAYITNSGTATATNLEVVIAQGTSPLTFDQSKKPVKNGAGTLTYAAAADNGEADLIGTDVIYEPNGTAEAAGSNDGWIGSSSGYSVFYSATIN
jgi:hypothetical protein